MVSYIDRHDLDGHRCVLQQSCRCLHSTISSGKRELIFPVDGFLFGVIGSLLLIIGMISGSYPAFVLSAFRPVTVLKGAVTSGGSKQTLRKVLVGVQTCVIDLPHHLYTRYAKPARFLQNKNRIQ